MSYISNLANRVNSIEAKDKFNLQELDINMLVPSDNNFYGIREIEELAESIRESGLMHNLVVRKKEDGKYEILSGERRYRALLSLNITKVPCQVKELNDVDSELLLIKANAEQRELTPTEKIETVNRLEKLYKQKKANGEEIPKGKLRDVIGKDIGLSGTQVGRYQKVDKKVIGPLKEKLDKGAITLNQAETLSKLSASEQEEINIKIDSMDFIEQKEEIDILVQGIVQPVEREEDKELINEMYKDSEDISSKKAMKDELQNLLGKYPNPQLIVVADGIQAIFSTRKIVFLTDNTLEVCLSGIESEDLFRVSFTQLNKCYYVLNLKLKVGYCIHKDIYLKFQ